MLFFLLSMNPVGGFPAMQSTFDVFSAMRLQSPFQAPAFVTSHTMTRGSAALLPGTSSGKMPPRIGMLRAPIPFTAAVRSPSPFQAPAFVTSRTTTRGSAALLPGTPSGQIPPRIGMLRAPIPFTAGNVSKSAFMQGSSEFSGMAPRHIGYGGGMQYDSDSDT
ncbi:uncharacterized protein LOC121370620 isoform X2 [Gigantopelta aegis]|uniref:uncharacterized protein LOC121370620 isoform X2 n=1 Tax=Gigantopelta aegis TaxID=1735272 RepID=UPI001B8898CF|nr:uncharacterized protein LOC121370620 isoform X2 [Gigantopelta aegis]